MTGSPVVQRNDLLQESLVSSTPPDDLVVMGHVSGAFGILGWISLVVHTEYLDSLLGYDVWWLGREAQWYPRRLIDGKVHGKKLVAQLEDILDRDVARMLKGCQVAVPRSMMPVLTADEFYWTDLEGLFVRNLQGEELGQVKRLFATGAHDMLVVKADDVERILPFTATVVLQVDLGARLITVDWGMDY